MPNTLFIEVEVISKIYQNFYRFLTYLNTFNYRYSMKIDVFDRTVFIIFFFVRCHKAVLVNRQNNAISFKTFHAV